MDEIEELRRQIRLRDEQIEEERRRHDEAIEEERRRRDEAVEKERRRRDEVIEERRRRETAEKLILPLALPQYLDKCHSLHFQIKVVTPRAPSYTTEDNTTSPAGRIFPRRIIPWNDFAIGQEEIWERLTTSFSSDAIFPSPHQLDYVESTINPISCEFSLQCFEFQTVQDAVRRLMAKVCDDSVLRARLGIRSTVSFEFLPNEENNVVDTISESNENMSNGASNAVTATSDVTKAFRRAVGGKSDSANQFCIHHTSDGRNVPVIAVEYKPPHKLTRDEVITGLKSEIQPERDVINKTGEDFEFTSRSLATTAITQIFSYMIAKGVQYGYVYTGETSVFLYIPDNDPSVVYYSVSVPSLDVLDDDANRLHRTAVAQMFAFFLRALRVRLPPQSWYDNAVKSLGTWNVEYEDVLKKIPPSVRKEPLVSPYKPRRWKGFAHSPIRDGWPRVPQLEKNDGEEQHSSLPSPPNQSAHAKDNSLHDNRLCIEDRPYCTPKCLLGLARGGPIDHECPNAANHGERHLDRSEFSQLIRNQLAHDRGPEADAVPLYVSGAIGSLFKVRLSAYGYTLVAKGVECHCFARLHHEEEMYNRLESIQGRHIPVCLGTVDLVLPYYFNGGVFRRFMFLSWAGQPLFDVAKKTAPTEMTTIMNKVSIAFEAIHELRVLHGDAMLRNILYDTRSENPVVVDFERATIHDRDPLSLFNLNQKRKQDTPQEKTENRFTKEIISVIRNIQWYIDKL